MSGTNTEESIINSIPEFEGESSDASSTPTTEVNQGSEGNQTSSTQPDTANVGDGSRSDTPRQSGARRRTDGLVEQPDPNNPNSRNLVDPVTGQVAVRGGIERRVYETGQRFRRENDTLRQQLQQAQGQIGATNEIARVANELQVTPENHVVALRVMSDFLKDPVKTLEYLVAEVKSKGFQIPFLTQGVTPGMDMAAIQRMIDQKMQPITQMNQQAQQHEQSRQEARRTLDTFLTSNPEAQANLTVIGEILAQEPTLSLHDAYVRLVTWSAQNGFDYTQPLEAQIRAQSGAQEQQPQNALRVNRPLPNGRSAANGTQRVDSNTTFNENSSWSEIVNSAMRESGML